MSSLKRMVTAVAIVGTLTVAAAAQQQTPANQEYMQGMDKMHKDMMAGMDPDPTKAWVKMMMPHHQGAIDMSQTVLKTTKDDEIRKKAEKVIKDQSEEIKELQAWLKKHGG